ncbi:MAG: hypothetical protein U1F25_10700 [Rubrivivax sp.]
MAASAARNERHAAASAAPVAASTCAQQPMPASGVVSGAARSQASRASA